MQGEFTCNCGAIVTHESKSISDRKHGVLRCHKCYDIWHKGNIVAKNKMIQRAIKERAIAQEKELKAKAAKDLAGAEFGAKTKESIHASSRIPFSKLENKKRLDDIMSDMELRKIEEDYL